MEYNDIYLEILNNSDLSVHYQVGNRPLKLDDCPVSFHVKSMKFNNYFYQQKNAQKFHNHIIR